MPRGGSGGKEVVRVGVKRDPDLARGVWIVTFDAGGGGREFVAIGFTA